MFSLWMSGFLIQDIIDHFAASGVTYTVNQLNLLAHRQNWTGRKKHIISATRETHDDVMKASKNKHIQTWALVTDALCDDIRQDYMDYKRDPEAFKAAVASGERQKPIWKIHGPAAAKILLETQYLLVNDFKQAPETEININNNTLETQLLTEPERRELVSMLAKAKEQALLKEHVPEGEVKETTEEECSTISSKKQD